MENKPNLFLFFFLISGLITVNAQGLCPLVQGIRENSNSKIQCSIPHVQGFRTWKISSNGQNFQNIDHEKFEVEPDGVFLKYAGSNDFFLRLEIKNPVTGIVIHRVTITVVIYVPPRIKDLTSVNDLNDEFAHISCIATGKPTPNVYWAFESKNGISRDLEGFTQFVDPFTKDLWSTMRAEESGDYYCRVTNDYGTDIKQTIVELEVAPTTITPSSEPNNTSIEWESTTTDVEATTIEGKLITKPTIRAREILTNTSNEALGCEATGYPLPKIIWYYGNRRIEANRTYIVHEGRISSYVEQSSYGLGIYTCYATNPFGTSSDFVQVAPLVNVSRPVPVSVVAIKSLVLVPESNVIECLATGNPLPKISWVIGPGYVHETEERKSLSAVSSFLKVNESSVGQYKCLASNSITLMIAHVNVMAAATEYYPAIARVFNTTVYIEVEDTIACIATGNPRPTVVWSKDKQELFSKEEFYDYERQEVTSYLSIINGTGTYTCIVFNELNRHRPTLEIKVRSTENDSSTGNNTSETSKPMIRALHSIFNNSENGTIGCEATGNPDPEIIWYYGNRRIIEDEYSYFDSQTISYVHPLKYGTGLFTCYAKNIHGVAADFVQVVTASNRSEPITLVPIQSVVNALESDTAECLATGNPVPSIVWFRNHERIQSASVAVGRPSTNSVRSTLRITTNTTERYRCVATNDNITGTYADIQVTLGDNDTYYPGVRVIKQTTDISKENTLSCTVTGNPRPTITWSKDDRELYAKEEYYDWVRQETTSYMEVKNGTGFYSCKANNSLGSATFEMQVLESSNLTDAQAPNVRAVQSVVDIEKNVTTIACVVTGRPLPIIQWKRSDTPIESVEHFNFETEETLSIVQLPENAVGRYSCQASNWLGADRATVRVIAGPNFFYPPDVEPVQRIVNIKEENQVGCVVTGNPKPDITWYFGNQSRSQRIFDGIDETFDNETLEYTSYLTITNGTGFYICQAQNTRGSSSILILVISNVNEDVNVTTNTTDISKPRVASLNPVYIITDNNTIGCEARGNPLPEIIWFYGNRQIQNDHSYSDSDRIFSYLNPSIYGTGLYTCYAKNVYATTADFVHVTPGDASYENEVTVVVTESVVNALESNIIECLAAGNPTPKITWYNYGEIVETWAEDSLINGVRSLARVSANSTGQYRCVASNNFSTVEADIRVISGWNDNFSPNIRVPKDQINILEEDTLACKIIGNPRPIITWYKGNQRLAGSQEYYDWLRLETTSYLTVNSTGFYHCVANNSNGVNSNEVLVVSDSNLTEFYRPETRAIKEVVNILEDDRIGCVITGNPKPNITWYFNEIQLSNDGIIEELNWARDEYTSYLTILNGTGFYFCEAINIRGRSKSVIRVISHNDQNNTDTTDIFKPTVRALESLLVQNGNSTIACEGKGNPVPEIIWYYGSERIQEYYSYNDYDRVFSYVNPSHYGNGLYTCYARNEHATTADFVQVVPYKFDEPSPITIIPVKSVVNAWETDTIECVATGKPRPIIFWDRNNLTTVNTPFQGGTRSSVRIFPNETGKYLCGATLDYVTASVAEIRIISHWNQTYGVGVRATNTLVDLTREDTISCTVTGNPKPTITWRKFNQNMVAKEEYYDWVRQETTSYLEINGIGFYDCVANNSGPLFSSSSTARIKVVEGSNSTDTVAPSMETVQSVVIRNESDSLSCIATGRPVPETQWLFDGEPIESTKYFDARTEKTFSTLRIPENTTGSSAVCVAFNAFGIDYRVIHVIWGKDDIFRPDIRAVKKRVNLLEEDRVVCVITGNPKPNIRWYLENYRIYDGIEEHFDSKKLEYVSSVRIRNQTGFYKCEAENVEGLVKWSEIQVISGSNVENDKKLNVRAIKSHIFLGDASEIGCEARGKPLPRIYWKFENMHETIRPLHTDEDVRNGIVQSWIKPRNVGIFSCYAENVHGKAYDNVIVLPRFNNTRDSNGTNSKVLNDTGSLVENDRIQILGVGESTVTFKIRNRDGFTYKRDIYYLYELLNNTNVTTGYLTASYEQQIFTLRELPKGSSVTLYFAEDYTTIKELNVESYQGKSVLLLPPVPEVSLKFATTEYVLLEWRLSSLSLSAIDYYEVTYAELIRNDEEFLPPKYPTETKIPIQIGSSYKLYRHSTSNYQVIKVRAHNEAGYSGWSSLLLSPYWDDRS